MRRLWVSLAVGCAEARVEGTPAGEGRIADALPLRSPQRIRTPLCRIVDNVVGNPLVCLFITDDMFPIIALPDWRPGRAAQFVDLAGRDRFVILYDCAHRTGVRAVGR